MNYEIIFYHSGRTSETEKLLNKKLSPYGVERAGSIAAITPTDLAKELEAALDRSRLVIIIGGLDGGRQSTDTILSSILSSGSGMTSEKLIDNEENISYIIKSEDRTIVVLPDEPDIISEMLDKRIISELRRRYSLTSEKDDSPTIESVVSELDKQLSKMDRTRTSIGNEFMRREEQSLKRLKVLIIALFAAGIALSALSIILFFI